MSFDFGSPEVARHYDELPLWSAPFARLLLDRVPLAPGQRMVDVGCGTGFLALELAQRCGLASSVLAVDPWAAALDVLRDKCRYLGVDNVQVRVSDAADLGGPDGWADVVVSNLGINNFADPPAVLAECRRVLRPGGSLLMTSNLVGHLSLVYDVYRETLVALDRGDRLPALDAEERHRATVGSASRHLADAGFEVADVALDTVRLRFADGTALLGHHFVRLGFVDGWQSVLDEPDVAEVFAELERRLNERAAAAGGLDLSVPAACFVARSR